MAKSSGKSKSVTPKGFTLPRAKKRLEELPQKMHARDPEHIITRLWEKENTRVGCLNFGLVPVDSILHECNEECGKNIKPLLFGVQMSHHYTGKFNERDIKIVSATVQWLATNVGRGFYLNFLDTLKKANDSKGDKAAS